MPATQPLSKRPLSYSHLQRPGIDSGSASDQRSAVGSRRSLTDLLEYIAKSILTSAWFYMAVIGAALFFVFRTFAARRA